LPLTVQLLVWIIVGLLGEVAPANSSRGNARALVWPAIGIGLIGALIGGFVFRLFGLFSGLDKVAISLRDVVAAVVGSLLVLAALWLWQRWKGTP
jgi:uncharacterized membrane protein YeaQ/YmgE (transglycosylase-associated protein family)